MNGRGAAARRDPPCSPAGCGGERRAGDPTTASTDTVTSVTADAAPALPVTLTDSTGSEVTVTSVDRIVPVDGDLAEIVFALGLGDQVVATDISATYPPEADALPDIGYQRALNAEPIAAVEPTVVLATDLAQPPETLEQLRRLRDPVVVIERQPALDGPGRQDRAVADVARSTRARRAVGRRPRTTRSRPPPPMPAPVASDRVSSPLYLRGDQIQLIFGEGTGIDDVLPAVGAVDVAAELGRRARPNRSPPKRCCSPRPTYLLVTTAGLESVGGVDGLLDIPGHRPDACRREPPHPRLRGPVPARAGGRGSAS